MKKLFLLCFLFISVATIMSPVTVLAQKETFDIITFTVPQGWDKKPSERAIQFSKEDAATGTYCLITLYSSLPGKGSPKENFDLAWSTLVKESVTVSADPEMQAPATEDGWEAQSGYSPFESDGSKGIIILVTSSGFQKMVNIVILTNTDEYEKDITEFLESVSFQKPVAAQTQDVVETQQAETANVQTNTSVQLADNEPQNNSNTNTQAPAAAVKSGFAFDTTNFDDGWNSTVQEDWVEVTKSNIKVKVLIHYPNKNADEYNTVLLDGLKNAWDILIAPKYSSASNMEFKSSGSWESIAFAEAVMVEKATGKTVYVVFFKKHFSGGSGKYIEFISPDKQTFEQEFGTYENASANWGSGLGFIKMANMGSYNKFAVAASDLTGKWSTSFLGMTQYVNAYTGFDAGTDTYGSATNFKFAAGQTYNWDIVVSKGFVGNIKFESVKSSGKFTVVNNWQVNFSDIQKRPKTYNAYFSCIKGFRILWLDDVAYAKVD